MRAKIGVPVSQQLFFCKVTKQEKLQSKLKQNHRFIVEYTEHACKMNEMAVARHPKNIPA